MNPTPHRSRLTASVRGAFPVTSTLALRFENCHIGVAASHTALTANLAEYFAPFVVTTPEVFQILISVHEAALDLPFLTFRPKAPDPGKTRIKEAWCDIPDGRVVRKVLTGMTFIFGDNDNLAFGPCLDNLNQVINFINNRYIEWKLCRKCLLGHAAGVMLGGRGLALAGFSGMGKSTLALHLMNRGATFVSNDRLLLESDANGLQMYGVAKLPRVNPGTLLHNPALTVLLEPDEIEALAQLSRKQLWELEQKYDVPVDRCFGEQRFVLHSPLHALVILNWQHTQQPVSVTPVSLKTRPELLAAFMKSTGLFFLPHANCRFVGETPEAYMDMLEACQVFEIGGGVDFATAADRCLELFRE